MNAQLRHRRDIILATRGAIFGAVVKTRKGDLRRFNARIYSDSGDERDVANNMIRVIEMNNLKRGEGMYRTIALEGLREIRFGQQTITFK